MYTSSVTLGDKIEHYIKKKFSGRTVLKHSIPNNSCIHSTLKDLEHKTSFFKCGMCLGVSFQREHYKGQVTVEKPHEHCLSQVMMVSINSNGSLVVCTLDRT